MSIVVVDVETNGLDPQIHQAVEVAWWNLDTDERGDFVPAHSVRDVLAAADLKALQVNDYVNKIAPRADDLDSQGAHQIYEELYNQLTGATLVGSNVQFDAAMISQLFARTLDIHPTPWHHRHWEIGPYAAGVLGLKHVPGLWEITQLLGLPENDHTAAGDVDLTGRAFLELRRRRQEAS